MQYCTCNCGFGGPYQHVEWPSGSDCDMVNAVPCTQHTPSGDEQEQLRNCKADEEKPASKTINPVIVSPGGVQKPLSNPTTAITPQGLQPKSKSN